MHWMFKIASQNLLIIVRGPSGSGKSSLSKSLSQQHNNAPILSTDDFFMRDGTYAFDVNQLAEAHGWNQKRAEKLMQESTPAIIIDNSNTRFWEMRVYAQLAQKYNYDVKFEEPSWSDKLKTPEGKWNVDFLEEMQMQQDRKKMNKSLDRSIIERMVNRYDYNPTVQSVLESQ